MTDKTKAAPKEAPVVAPRGLTSHGTHGPTEPDKFLKVVNGTRAVGATTAANMVLLRACFAAAGMHSSKADHVVKQIQRRSGVVTWNTTTPDLIAAQLRNWGYALTLAGTNKDFASVLTRTFPLMGNGLGGPVITTFTVPTAFKTPA